MTTETNLPSLRESSPSINSSTEQSESVNTNDNFQWTKQWYPIAVVDFLDPSRPHQVQLLGQNLVLWGHVSKVWIALNCYSKFIPINK